MKKFLSIALALLMVCVMLPVVALADDATPANVAKIGNTEYPTLQAAVESITDGAETTITLLDNCDGNGITVSSGKNIIFDMNGFTYTVDGNLAGSSGTVSQAFQLLKGSNITFKNGKITSSKAVMLVQNYCNLTLDNMVLDGSNLNGGVCYTMSNNCGNVVITGNTEIIAKANGVAFDVYYWSESYPDGVTVTLDSNFTGTIDGPIEVATDGKNVSDWTEKVELNINGAGTVKGLNVSAPAGQDAKEVITITNGTFSTNVADYAGNNLVIQTVDFHVGAAAVAAVSNASKGETVYVLNGTTLTDVPAGVIIQNRTDGTITVNGKDVELTGDAGYTVPASSITIIVPGDTTPETPKTDDQKNPATGANDFVGLAAAAAVVALLGSAVVLRKK